MIVGRRMDTVERGPAPEVPGSGQPSDGFKVTPYSTRSFMIRELMGNWHRPVELSACCRFHASLAAFDKDLIRLRHDACSNEFMPSSAIRGDQFVLQCADCLCLDEVSGSEKIECAVCGYDGAFLKASATDYSTLVARASRDDEATRGLAL